MANKHNEDRQYVWKIEFCLFLWLVCFGAVLGIGIIGCGGDEEAEVEDDSDEGVVIENGLLDPGYEYVTWYLASIDGKSINDLALYQPEIGDILVNSEIKDIEHLLKKLESQIDLVRTDRMRLSNRGGMYVAILLYGPPDLPLGLLEAGAQCTPYKPSLTMTIRNIL